MSMVGLRRGEERCGGEGRIVESKILPFAWFRGSACREFTYCSVKGSTWLVGGNIIAGCTYVSINSAEGWEQGVLKRLLGRFMVAITGQTQDLKERGMSGCYPKSPVWPSFEALLLGNYLVISPTITLVS